MKGFDFEDECEPILGKLAKDQGDFLDRTRKKCGRIKDCKTGDFILTIGKNTEKKIVWEFKNKNSRSYSIDHIKKELDVGKENRGAEYGIFVVKDIESIWLLLCKDSHRVVPWNRGIRG